MDNYDLEDPKNIILRNISRIKKSDSGYFNISELKMRKEIKKNKIDVEVVFKELVNEGMMIKGKKKDTYCMTREGKLKEHSLERLYNDKGPFKIFRK